MGSESGDNMTRPWLVTCLVSGPIVLGVGGVILLVLSYQAGYTAGVNQMGDEVIRQLARGDGEAGEGVHTGRIRRLAGKLSAEGYVWETPEGHQNVANNPLAWEGGDIVHLLVPQVTWHLTREGLPGKTPEIVLVMRSDEAGLLQELGQLENALRERRRFDEVLPAEANGVFNRLANYAYQLYEEDHVGRELAPQQAPLGNATILIRRKYAPGHYDLEVADICGPYRAELAIGQFPKPQPHHVVELRLRKNDQ